jgi:prophage regulatory protein
MSLKLFSIPESCADLRICPSTFHNWRRAGLMVDPVPIGPNTVRVPADELEQLKRARVAGATDAEIRALVQRLHAARRSTVEA